MIRTRTQAGVCRITLDRPQRRNALDWEDLDELDAAVEAAIEADDVSVVYLHGAGDAFCAGADLETVAGLESEDAEAFARRGQGVAATLADPGVVTVAGIDGAARGGGVELALACDMRVATPDATLAEPGVSLGLFGAWGGTIRLPQIVGLGEAMDLALTGRVVDAGEALRMGLVSQVTREPQSVAVEIAEYGPEPLRTITRRLRDTAPIADQEPAEAAAFARLVEHAEFETDE